MGLSIWQILVVGILFILLFGRGKITALMTDLASGIKSFKAGMKEDNDATKLELPEEGATFEHTTYSTSDKKQKHSAH